MPEEDETPAAPAAAAPAAAAPVTPPRPPVAPEPADDRELKEIVLDHVQRIARKPETKFGFGGMVAGAVLTVAVFGAALQPAGVQDARDDARLAIEKLAVVQARLDALDGGHVPAATTTEHAATPAADHATTDPQLAAATDEHGADTDATDEHASDAAAKKDEPHWSYSGETGPSRWSSMANEYAVCSSGKEQSPVDLAHAQLEGAVELAFSYVSSAGTVTDNGHTIQVDIPGGGSVEVGGRRFDLVQFHFHGPSEHTVGGRSFPLELHLVHKDKQGKLAVVGVLIEAGSASSALSKVIASLPPTPGRPESLSGSINPTTLLPKMTSSFQYSGSLTTPPCTEGVAWSVLVAPITMSQEQIDTLRERFHGANNRPIQPLNQRRLFVEFGAH